MCSEAQSYITPDGKERGKGPPRPGEQHASGMPGSRADAGGAAVWLAAGRREGSLRSHACSFALPVSRFTRAVRARSFEAVLSHHTGPPLRAPWSPRGLTACVARALVEANVVRIRIQGTWHWAAAGHPFVRKTLARFGEISQSRAQAMGLWQLTGLTQTDGCYNISSRSTAAMPQ